MGGARLYLVGADISGSKKKLFARVRRLKSQAEAIERALDGETGYKRVLHRIAGARGVSASLMAKVAAT